MRPIPTELRKLPEVRYGLIACWVLLGTFVLTFPLWASPGREQLASLIFIYSIVAVSLVVLTGWVGQISLGQWALVGFGAATSGVLVGRHPPTSSSRCSPGWRPPRSSRSSSASRACASPGRSWP